MNPQEFEEQMAHILRENANDNERGHLQADDLLCHVLEFLGYRGGVKLFREYERWYA